MELALNAPIRILHCIETLWSGGVEQMKLIEAKGLDKDRYQQALLCTRAKGALPRQFMNAGCAVREIGEFRGIYDFERYRKAYEFVREFRPHIIHGAVFEGVAIAALVGRAARVPIIVGEEITEPRNRSWRGHFLFRSFTVLMHHMVAVSPQVEDYLLDRIWLPRKKVTLINNGIYEPRAADEDKKNYVKSKHGIQSSDFVIGCCCRLSDVDKRISDLIRAFTLLSQERSNLKLLLVGDGPDAKVFHALAEELNVRDKVVFAGYQGETRAYFEIMNVFALASAFEGLPVALLEAMFAKLPVVATNVGGVPAAVIDGVTGFLVAPNAPQELAAKIGKIIDDVDLRRTMGAAGLARARSEFGADRYLSECDALYQRLARGRVG